MEANKDNANPTILNPSDLPSRRPTETITPRADGSTGLFDSLLPPQHAPTSSLSHALTRTASSSSGATDTDGSDADADADIDADEPEPIDAQEIYDLIAPISDPEHPLSLGSLNVIQLRDIHVTEPAGAGAGAGSGSKISRVLVEITPTITHCSLATVIGLGVRVRLEQALPPRFRVDVRVKKGTHSTDEAVSKQLGDKERVAAALENGTLVGVLDRMLATCA